MYFLFRYGLVEKEEEIHFIFKKKDDKGDYKKLEQPEIKRFDKSGKLLFPDKD